jgi:hypothetical protein
MFTFGQLPTYSGDAKFEAALSEDKRAFTVTFSDGATIQLSKASAPIATKVFSLVIPLEGTGDKAEIEFILQGGRKHQRGYDRGRHAQRQWPEYRYGFCGQFR